jgi:hypothetical protein
MATQSGTEGLEAGFKEMVISELRNLVFGMSAELFREAVNRVQSRVPGGIDGDINIPIVITVEEYHG